MSLCSLWHGVCHSPWDSGWDLGAQQHTFFPRKQRLHIFISPRFSPNEPLLQTKSYAEPKGMTHKSAIVVVTDANGCLLGSLYGHSKNPRTPEDSLTVTALAYCRQHSYRLHFCWGLGLVLRPKKFLRCEDSVVDATTKAHASCLWFSLFPEIPWIPSQRAQTRISPPINSVVLPWPGAGRDRPCIFTVASGLLSGQHVWLWLGPELGGSAESFRCGCISVRERDLTFNPLWCWELLTSSFNEYVLRWTMALCACWLPNPAALFEYGDALEKGWGQWVILGSYVSIPRIQDTFIKSFKKESFMVVTRYLLYPIPIAVVINYHQVSGLRQYEFIFLQFCR